MPRNSPKNQSIIILADESESTAILALHPRRVVIVSDEFELVRAIAIRDPAGWPTIFEVLPYKAPPPPSCRRIIDQLCWSTKQRSATSDGMHAEQSHSSDRQKMSQRRGTFPRMSVYGMQHEGEWGRSPKNPPLQTNVDHQASLVLACIEV